MGYSMSVMYRVAVPEIPSIFRSDGERKPVFESLWIDAPGLDMELWLSTTKKHDRKKESSILLFSAQNLQFGWDLDVALDLLLEFSSHSNQSFLRASCDQSSIPVSVHCVAAAASWVDTTSGSMSAVQSGIIGEWEGLVALKILNALQQGKAVYAHASIAWSGSSTIPGSRGFSPSRAISDSTSLTQVHA